MMVPLLVMVLLLGFMFWSTRNQQKKQQATLDSLTKGDRVVTQSGLVGKLVEIGTRYAKVEVSPGVKIEMLRSGLVGKDPGDVEPKKKD
jgi:preprotein translocase subunit YajC